jgi:hypothetical protein
MTPELQARRKAAAIARHKAIAEWRDKHVASVSVTAAHFGVSMGLVSKAYAAYGHGIQFGSTAYCRTVDALAASLASSAP